MPLNTNYINVDAGGLVEYSQYETTDNSTYLAQSRFTPQEKESGLLTIIYNAVNIATAAAVNRMKLVRYKRVNGVVTLIGATNVYNNADTGMTTVDTVVTVQGSDIVLSITGLAAATVRHSIKVERLSSQLKN